MADKVKRSKYNKCILIFVAVVLVLSVAVGIFSLTKAKRDKGGPTDGIADTTDSAAEASNPELEKMLNDGRLKKHIECMDSRKLKKITGLAVDLEYTEIGEKEYAARLKEIFGVEAELSDEALSEFTAEKDGYYFVDACDDENEDYLVFDKSEKTMLVLSRKAGSDGYWMCERITNADDIAKKLNAGSTERTELHYVLASTGETVFYGVDVNEWCFYYNDGGDLFLCMDFTDESEPKCYDSDFIGIESFAGQLMLTTVLDGIEDKYGTALDF